MTIELVVLWGLAGWCGTPPFPRPWPWPGPDPNPWAIKVVGVVGGLVGGVAFWQLFGGGIIVDGMVAINAAATAVGAYIGSVFLGDMYGLATGRGKAKV